MGSEIRIEMTGHGRGRVLIDGKEVEHVAGVEFSFSPDSLNVVKLSVHASKVVVSGPVELEENEIEIGLDAPVSGSDAQGGGG